MNDFFQSQGIGELFSYSQYQNSLADWEYYQRALHSALSGQNMRSQSLYELAIKKQEKEIDENLLLLIEE